MWIKLSKYSFNKMQLTMSPVRWRPFCSGANIRRRIKQVRVDNVNYLESWGHEFRNFFGSRKGHSQSVVGFSLDYSFNIFALPICISICLLETIELWEISICYLMPLSLNPPFANFPIYFIQDYHYKTSSTKCLPFCSSLKIFEQKVKTI